MAILRKVTRIGTSKFVSLPKGWLDLIERETGKSLKEVAVEVNGCLKIRPILPKKTDSLKNKIKKEVSI